ncbi:MAG TPA: DNA-binding response regulator [Opitutae bacterium]|nr:DNA-binding response regulator [Opitutae bacterium]
MNKHIRIMLVEDHVGYQDTIAIALEQHDHMELDNEFGTAEIALRALQNTAHPKQPDVILLDLNLPGMSGLEALPWIKQYAPNSEVIILTQSDNAADVTRAISEGAAGYLLKSATFTEITEGIETVMEGGATLDPEVARFIINTLRSRPKPTPPEKTLSEREMEVLELIGQGLAKKEIAHQLKISVTTVAYHVQHVYEKLEVPNAPAAVDRAHRLGLFKPNT